MRGEKTSDPLNGGMLSDDEAHWLWVEQFEKCNSGTIGGS